MLGRGKGLPHSWQNRAIGFPVAALLLLLEEEGVEEGLAAGRGGQWMAEEEEGVVGRGAAPDEGVRLREGNISAQFLQHNQRVESVDYIECC